VEELVLITLSGVLTYVSCLFLQINIAYPATGNQKFVDIDDEKKL